MLAAESVRLCFDHAAMKRVCIITGLLLAGLGSYLIWRSIPERYAWLVFGPEGKTRMLLCMDRDAASIDFNRDGKFDLTERIRMPATNHSIPILDGKTSYTITGVSRYDYGKSRDAIVSVDIKGTLEFRQIGDVMLSRSRKGAAVAHFNGPLTVQAQTILWELPPDLVLRRGDKPTDIRVNIGTIRKADRCWTAIRTHDDKRQSVFPRDVFPVVNVEFPTKSGTSSVVIRYPLDEVC